jgi:hypothetical protein
MQVRQPGHDLEEVMAPGQPIEQDLAGSDRVLRRGPLLSRHTTTESRTTDRASSYFDLKRARQEIPRPGWLPGDLAGFLGLAC